MTIRPLADSKWSNLTNAAAVCGENSSYADVTGQKLTDYLPHHLHERRGFKPNAGFERVAHQSVA